ncbi:hypothetical protein VP1G_11294 [Cytospora mali]|uniref:Uncharacterized protein n=1 Tax=Cytospora mali TaxID=578113 RepID=A0A194VBJ7_CYTMA|nr:hypothetical protein VP1G_11294 [Valsa mali var. pyri (nom. inval.)]
MGDPLSIAASIAGVISLADVVFSRTMRYLKLAKNADEDLDSLEHCPSDKDCRIALDRLPPGLNESYARILQQLPDGKERLVQKVLDFIACTHPKLEIPLLREALSVPDTMNAGQASDPHSIIREDSITKLCKSLVRKSNDGNYYEFAHFTVQEFLES